MTITREKLELAARAAGLIPTGTFPLGEDPVASIYVAGTNVHSYRWSPLTDHGQLLDLAMACGIDIMPSVGGIRYWTKRQPTDVIWVDVDCQDFAALAEAVITAAAEQQLVKETKGMSTEEYCKDWDKRQSTTHFADDATLSRIAELERENAAKQARIDELMFEYCPEEMTREQIDNYAKHQRPVDAETEAAINAAIACEKENERG